MNSINPNATEALAGDDSFHELAKRAYHTFSFRHPLGLTRVEARLFDFLSDGKPHSKDAILSGVFGTLQASHALVGVNMHTMRRKIEPHGYRIESGRGPSSFGWRLCAPHDSRPSTDKGGAGE